MQINRDDILPKKLCQQCFSDLTLINDFRNKCKRSEEILQTSLTCHYNGIECSENYEIQIKVEEHDVSSESEFKTETAFVKEESNLQFNNLDEEHHICDVCSKCKYT